MDLAGATWAGSRYEATRHLREWDEALARVLEGEENALRTVRRLVDSEDGGAAAAIFTPWTCIQHSDYISQGELMDIVVCVLLSEKFEELDCVFVPAPAGIMRLDDPEDFIEDYKDFWILIANKIAIDPMLSDLMMIRHVLDQAE
jgi:hypothetical protein